MTGIDEGRDEFDGDLDDGADDAECLGCGELRDSVEREADQGFCFCCAVLGAT